MTTNLKPMVYYQLRDHRSGALVFLAVHVGLILLCFVSLLPAYNTNFNMSYTGYDVVCAIYMLVCGIVAPRPYMRLGVQMGTSRRTSFLGMLISTAVISLAVSVVLHLLFIVSQLIAAPLGNLTFSSIFSLVYLEAAIPSTLTGHLSSVLFAAALMVMSFFLGLFFTFLFWRLGKVGKTVAAFSIAAVLLGLPGVLYQFHVVLAPVTRLIEKIAIACVNSAWAAMAVFLVAAAIFCIIGWLLVRRANIRGAASK